MNAPIFDSQLLAKYDVVGPRYTSYPTAPQFTNAFGEAQYRDHARASNDDPIPRPLSIYVHLPFCASPCFYCGCSRIVTRDRSRVDAYLARLLREVELQGGLFDRDRRVIQLHLGGGTPNYFDSAQLQALLDALGGAFNLERGPTREFSIETDPRFADAATMHDLAGMGFNRVNFGVQDFDPVVQEAINRIQPVEQTLDVIAAVRAAGFQSVGIDLIYGLPRQTEAGFAATLDTVLAIRPNRIALYSYAHLPELFRAQRQIRAEDLPNPAAKLGLMRLAIETLTRTGYHYVGMDHFALPEDELVREQQRGRLQRNFQGYSTHAECDLIGLGMSAIGRVGDAYAQNAKDLIGYDAALDAGRLPIARGIVLDDDDQVRGAIIQGLMCCGEIDIGALEQRFGLAFEERFAAELAQLRELAADGLVEFGCDRIRVTPRGRLLLRPIAMCFDAYLARPRPAVARFSRVI
jgi:oxygen-independent coproporphyrinogen-3 oxidase